MFDQAAAERASAGAPEWVAERRAQAYAAFEKLDMPTSREEVWRYLDLDFRLDEYGLAAEPGPSQEASPLGGLADPAGTARVVDGFPVACEGGADGTVFTPLTRALVDHEDLVRGAYGQGVPMDLDVFSAAHHAFGADGVFLYVPAGVNASRPYVVDVQAVTAGVASFPRMTVVVEDNADASLVVNYRSADSVDALVVPQLEVSVRDNARCSISVVQEWGYQTTSIAQARLVAGRDAFPRLTEVGLGGRLSRLHLTVDLMGRGSSAEIIGAYFGEDSQTLDYRYFMNHVAPNTTSEMFLKGAVEDEALSVFTGMIRIEPEAQRTNAHQTNRNLILSDGASAQSVPNLEILANDVRCGHGSTVGPLDEEQRYYLMSRGLDAERADRLQVRGFFEEAIARFPQRELAGPVRTAMNRKFVEAQEEGRV